MPLPHFLCIGAQKAGTTWLFERLNEHPGAWLPPIKELHFFDHLFVPRNREWTLWHIQTSVRRAIDWHVKNNPKPDLDYIRYLALLATDDVFSERWFRSAFDRPGARNRICGDVTPEYSTVPEAGIHYLRGLLGAVKIIYIIRDPVRRALSQVRMQAMRQHGGEVDEATWLQLADHPDISNRGAYSEYVPRWKRAFAAEDLLFVPYRRIAEDPLAVMRDMEALLGLAPHEYGGIDRKVHATAPLKVPDAVHAVFHERYSGEAAFVEQEFGSAFAALT
ncbi:MAG TPA: sulfotransferase [Propylenella sp.]